MKQKVDHWVEVVNEVSKAAVEAPQVAFSTITAVGMEIRSESGSRSVAGWLGGGANPRTFAYLSVFSSLLVIMRSAPPATPPLFQIVQRHSYLTACDHNTYSSFLLY